MEKEISPLRTKDNKMVVCLMKKVLLEKMIVVCDAHVAYHSFVLPQPKLSNRADLRLHTYICNFRQSVVADGTACTYVSNMFMYGKILFDPGTFTNAVW